MAEVKMNDVNWCVHVLGPDNVLAATSFRGAVERCHEINLMLVNFYESGGKDPMFPRVFAQVAIWEQVASGPHDPDKTDWADAAQRLLALLLDQRGRALEATRE